MTLTPRGRSSAGCVACGACSSAGLSGGMGSGDCVDRCNGIGTLFRHIYRLRRAICRVQLVCSIPYIMYIQSTFTRPEHEGSALLSARKSCSYAALPAVILWPVEVWTSNV